MVTEVAEAVEVVPICEKHSVEKVKRRQKRIPKGWDWTCRQCRNEDQRKRDQATREKEIVVDGYVVNAQRVRFWRYKYGLRPEDVVGLYKAQEGKCAFGGEPLAWEDMRIDHKHGYPGCRKTVSGQAYGCPKEAVRGLVCHNHNTLQGKYEADPEGYMAVARWHVLNNGGKWTELCGCQEAISA